MFSIRTSAWYTGLICLICLSVGCWLSPVTLPSAYQELIAFAGGGLLFLGALSGPRKALALPVNTVLFLLLALFVAVQSRVLPFAYILQPLMGVVYFVWAALLSWAAWQWHEQLGGQRFYRDVAMAFLAGSVLAAIIGLLSVLAAGGLIGLFKDSGFFESGQLNGPLQQRNQYVTLLLSGLVCLAWVVEKGRSRWIALILGGVVLAFPAGMTGSRTGLLVCGLLVLYPAMLLAFPVGRKHAVFCVNLLLLALLALMLQFTAPVIIKALGLDSLSAVARTVAADDGGSTLLRLQAWQRAWQMFLEHPMFGVGMNNLAIVDFGFRAGAFSYHLQSSAFFTHCHNLFLQLLAELGVVGGIALLLLCWQTVAGIARQWREPFGLFCIAVLMPMAVHSLLEYPLWYAYFLGPWLLLAQGRHVWILDLRYLRSFYLVTLVCIVGLASLGWNLVRGISDLDGVADFLAKEDKAGAYQQAWNVMQNNGLVAPYAHRAITMLVLPGDNATENLQSLQIVNRVMNWKPYPLAPYKLAIWQMAVGEDEQAYAMLKAAMTVYPEDAKGFPEILKQANAPSFDEKRRKLIAKFEELSKAKGLTAQ